MPRVYTLHGVAPNVDPRRFIYRNIADLASLSSILSSRPPFVPLAAAVAGDGDALTIDDATRCAADAAMLARRHGHAVTLFVNPEHVDPPQPHSFHLLNVLMDGLHDGGVELGGKRHATRTLGERSRLRAHLKDQLRDVWQESDRRELIERLASEWNVPLDVPSFLEPLGIGDLKTLLDAGVEIQNHGWSHCCHRRLDPAESAHEIERGAAWLADRLGVEARFFAVPYGDAVPGDMSALPCDLWLTVDERYPSGPLSHGIWNRDNLEAAPARGRLEELGFRAKELVRRSKRRWRRVSGSR